MPNNSLAEVTSAPELGETSEAEQMYLITVAREAECGRAGPVRVGRIAEVLKVSVPSANEMIRKLHNRGLLTYEPYRGVVLTAAGAQIAAQVLRTRRLWATFLVDHLGFSPAAADDQACHLEHATTPEAADRLATFLGNPEAGPLGNPIPALTGATVPATTKQLSEAAVAETVEIVAIRAGDTAAEFLAAEGLRPGVSLHVIAQGLTGLLVAIGKSTAHLSSEVAAAVDVRTIGDAG
jgi:DtxR family Mn-dependent transcriptional regulator